MKYCLLLSIVLGMMFIASCAPSVGTAKSEDDRASAVDVREQYSASAKDDNRTFLDTLNRGREIALAETDVPKLEVASAVPAMEFAAVPAAQMTSSTVTPAQEPRFRIQIMASSQVDMVRREQLNAESVIGLPVFMISEQSLYKLYVGEFKSRAEAEAALPGVRNKGYKDAWIVGN